MSGRKYTTDIHGDLTSSESDETEQSESDESDDTVGQQQTDPPGQCDSIQQLVTQIERIEARNANMAQNLDMVASERFEIANELKEVKKQIEQFLVIHQENATLKLELEKEANERTKMTQQLNELKDQVLAARQQNYAVVPANLATKNVSNVPAVEQQNQQAPLSGFIKYETQSWLANRWSRIACSPCLLLSTNGLCIKRKPNCHGDGKGITYTGFIQTIYGIEFPPTCTCQTEIAQVGYFEMKFIKGTFTYGFCAKDYIPLLKASNLFRLMSTTGHYINGADKQWFWLPHKHQDLIPYDETAVVGCGLMKHSGQRKIFFTRNGQLLAKPIALPSSAAVELFPFIFFIMDGTEFEDTNFGHRPFVFKIEDNLETLSQEMIVGVDTEES